MAHLVRRAATDRAEGGQGIVEFALIVPVFITLLLGMLEFGFVFDENLTLEYASREGARVGSALVDGGGSPGCTTVDNQIIAAVERVLTSDGSRITLERVGQIRIYLATATGSEAGPVDVWIYAAGQGPVVDGKTLDFKLQSTSWSACSRTNAGSPAPSIGVSVSYSYQFQTPIGIAVGFVGGSLPMADHTIMAMNPTAN